MENKKDIGKAISDKLSSLDKTPRENVWSGISYELQKKKKRRIAFFFFWSRTIGLLLIGAIAALYVYNHNDGFNSETPNNSNESIIVNGNDGKANTNNSGNGNTEINDANTGLNNESTAEDGNNVGNNNEDADGNNKNNNGKKNSFKNKSNLKNGKWVEQSADGKNAINAKSKKGSGKANRNNNAASGTFKNSRGSGTESRLSKAKSGKSGAQSSQFSKVSSKKSSKKVNGKSENAKETAKENVNLNGAKTEQNSTALFDPTSLQNNSSVDKTKEINTKKPDSLIAKKEREKKKNINMYPEDKKEQDSAKGFVKFHVDAFVSPTYYGYLSDKSTLSRFLDSNSKTSEVEMNYGAGLSYELTERVAIRIGYTKVKLNYTTHDALIDTPNYFGIVYNPGVTNQTILDASNNPETSGETMDITQNIGYSEISLEGRYKLLDKKFGINSIFGFSFSMLNENTVNIKTDNGFSQSIGKTKGLFDTAASVNIGLGLDYQVFKNTKVFLEPMFNYQAMSFDNSSYKPYYFGLHFGIRYALINK